MNLGSLALSVATALTLLVPRSPGTADEGLWALLQAGGQVVLMRHAVTPPGVGDPPGMRIDDCSTQRNLTEEGRRDAKAIGEVVRKRGVSFARVLSSPLCRCLETARLAFGRAEVAQSGANPLGGGPDAARQVREMRAIAAEKHRGGNVVLVSHGTTIAAVTQVDIEPGEMLVVTPHGDGGFEVRGVLRTLPP